MIAVIDDAVDTRHPEFEGRIVGGRDIEGASDRAVPQAWEPHGTKCAGLACAGGVRVAGVAPEASLMPVRVATLAQKVGDPAEAEAMRWAAEQGAHVISCAWGPPEPTSVSGVLPDRTRNAIDWAVDHGRGGKGCVIVWSAGNDNVDVALNGYASHPRVIAAGACNDGDERSGYSNWGDALWCVFPSSDPYDRTRVHQTIATTTPVGSFLLGETYYTASFGHTSASCAGVAGLCALILSANPDLTWWGVKEVLRDCCVKIDAEGGTYDQNGHSPYYGYGRPDAAVAVQLALERR